MCFFHCTQIQYWCARGLVSALWMKRKVTEPSQPTAHARVVWSPILNELTSGALNFTGFVCNKRDTQKAIVRDFIWRKKIFSDLNQVYVVMFANMFPSNANDKYKHIIYIFLSHFHSVKLKKSLITPPKQLLFMTFVDKDLYNFELFCDMKYNKIFLLCYLCCQGVPKERPSIYCTEMSRRQNTASLNKQTIATGGSYNTMGPVIRVSQYFLGNK